MNCQLNLHKKDNKSSPNIKFTTYNFHQIGVPLKISSAAQMDHNKHFLSMKSGSNALSEL